MEDGIESNQITIFKFNKVNKNNYIYVLQDGKLKKVKIQEQDTKIQEQDNKIPEKPVNWFNYNNPKNF